jgi:uncharacterized protein with PIN domain
MTKTSELSPFWIWDFDIHLTFGFWHLALIHSYFDRCFFLCPSVPTFRYSNIPLSRGFRMETRFVADAMLGRLAKWLRVLGYDTHYQSHYPGDLLSRLVQEGRTLLSRQPHRVEKHPDGLLLHSDGVTEQILEMKEKSAITADRSRCFTRCLRCNVLLRKAAAETTRENVPEYVFYENAGGIRFCPSCGRYFWPGTHRARMEKQLEKWGF